MDQNIPVLQLAVNLREATAILMNINAYMLECFSKVNFDLESVLFKNFGHVGALWSQLLIHFLEVHVKEDFILIVV